MSLKPILKPDNKRAHIIIIALSLIVFIAVVALDRLKVQPEWPFAFNVHYFATFNAIINGMVFFILIMAVRFARKKRFETHKKWMLTAVVLSGLFLVSYIAHHLFAGSTIYGGEGTMKTIYYILLITHIPLAGIILPFILYTVYRGLTGEYAKHRKLARYTYPLWVYVAFSGVIVYLMISPYYNW